MTAARAVDGPARAPARAVVLHRPASRSAPPGLTGATVVTGWKYAGSAGSPTGAPWASIQAK
ncbi:hypothetical protein ACFWA9_19870 [Kitasatospora sp. NPDC059973]|uniref:hypothetical protein n=1 Tax=Kitasatospora sp. NPDC059973 TaxID=3347020 RepID=UPI0036CEE65F